MDQYCIVILHCHKYCPETITWCKMTIFKVIKCHLFRIHWEAKGKVSEDIATKSTANRHFRPLHSHLIPPSRQHLFRTTEASWIMQWLGAGCQAIIEGYRVSVVACSIKPCSLLPWLMSTPTLQSAEWTHPRRAQRNQTLQMTVAALPLR